MTITLFIVAAASVAQQMEPARQGMLQCQSPDVVFKTCLSLSKVTQLGPTTWQFDNEMLIDPSGPVVMRGPSMTFVEGNRVCDRGRLPNLESWTVTVAGRPATSAQATKYRSRLRKTFSLFGNRNICTEIVIGEADMSTVIGTVGGKRVPPLDYAMKWVNPKEGWTVR